MKLLIDGDTIAYTCGYATNDIDSLGLVRKIVSSKIQRICDTWGTYDYELYLTDTSREANFRDSLATIQPYKGTRIDEKPRWLPEIRDYLMDTFDAKIVTGIEADDELGKRQTKDTMIVTIDKDLLMVPGRHYNFRTDRVCIAYDPGQLTLITKKTRAGSYRYMLKGVGFKWFCAQCFLGDRVDNIPGLRGYGDKKTYIILHNIWTVDKLWARTIKEFKEKKNLKQLPEIAQLLWIYRDDNSLLKKCLEKIDD